MAMKTKLPGKQPDQKKNVTGFNLQQGAIFDCIPASFSL